MGTRVVRGGRPVDAGAPLTPQPWWFGPTVLDPPGEGAPFDLVLLDRDGTINVRIPDGYVTRPDELRLLPGAAAAVGALTAAGCRTVLVTNQRGVARGLMDRSDIEAVHEHLNGLLLVQVAHPAVVTLGFRRHGRIREGSTDAGEDVFFS